MPLREKTLEEIKKKAAGNGPGKKSGQEPPGDFPGPVTILIVLIVLVVIVIVTDQCSAVMAMHLIFN